MNYRLLGRTGLHVSELGFGALEIGRDWPYWRQNLSDFSRPTESDAARIVHEAIDRGINFFDTAPAYFKSEEILGNALKGIRSSVILATKCGEWFDGSNSVYNYSAGETMAFIESSLRLLQTDVLDLLQIHSAPPEVIRSGETLSAMKKAQEHGKVRFIGLSTDSLEAARCAVESGEYDTLQVSYNMLRRDFADQIFPAAKDKNLGIIVKDGMAKGMLAGKHSEVANEEERLSAERFVHIAETNRMPIHEMALRFVLSNSAVSSVIVGTKNSVHLCSNIAAAAQGPLPESYGLGH
ncbi:MAG: aldo/keto reductase [Ignavibacteriales bacterium]|nr:aldo/keto reductase [Ignavibacteriales bacterium]